MPDLLLELGTEEIPARFLDKAIAALRAQVEQGLAAAALPATELRAGGTPRRLVVWAGGLPARQPDRSEEKAGPAKDSAFKDGKPTIAAQKFAESMGLTVEQLEVREIAKKGKAREYLYASRSIPGRDAVEVLGELIPAWIEAIAFPKSMRWVSGAKLRFARPLRRITALLGEAQRAEVVPTSWAGVESGREVEGHRFLVREPLVLDGSSWETYVQRLERAHVVVEPATRRRRIADGLEPHLGAEGLERRRKLVDEVANLVEWPAVDVGSFAPRFLELPEIVVVEAMTGHQRYFPIRASGRTPGRSADELQPRFAYVANRPLDPVIRQGNERVLAARLQDALFFFEQDQKRPLSERVADLGAVVFMQGLGSYLDRVPRVESLALEVGKAAGWVPEDAKALEAGQKISRSYGAGGVAAHHVHTAAQLARADLTTEMVGEFPELQGEIGTIYARRQGQPEEVAVAIREAYLPRGEGDALPESQVGIALALADKLDTIASAWATGKRPTGSKDPFMVRRSALGVLRILRERQLDLGLERLIAAAVDGVLGTLRAGGEVKPPPREELVNELRAYFRDRLEVLATKDEGRRHDLTRAALDAGADPTNVLDFWRRLDALDELATDQRFVPLCELVDRTRTITAKNGADVDPADVDVSRLEHPAEQALHQAIQGCREAVRAAIAERRYVDAGRRTTDALAEVTHTFFEPAPQGVFVMDEDPRLRTNRLALLKQVHALLAEGFADLAKVAAKK